MNRKDIIVISVLVNAGLLVILLISALTNKESYLIASSAEIASSILEKNESGMVIENSNKIPMPQIAKEETIEISKEEKPQFVKLETEEDVIHKLPKIAKEDRIKSKASKSKNQFLEIAVKKGDSLEKIAKKHNLTVAKLMNINDLPNSFLRIGQKLLIPKNAPLSKSIEKKNTVKVFAKEGDYYTVRAGDNPWTIAIKHHLKVNELLKMNNLDNTSAKKLRPGDKLRIR